MRKEIELGDIGKHKFIGVVETNLLRQMSAEKVLSAFAAPQCSFFERVCFFLRLKKKPPLFPIKRGETVTFRRLKPFQGVVK